MTSDPAVTDASTDEHFIGHVVASAHDIEASEDILTASGAKLLAKGAKVDESTRERLLRHKLAKPLEQCLAAADAITTEMVARVAEKLLDEQSLLRRLCPGGGTRKVTSALSRLHLTTQLRSLLSLYAELPSDRLEHSVAVALIAHGIARQVLDDERGHERVLLTAGLFHDVGELYVNPEYLRRELPLEAAHWKHIVAHPVIGHRVLHDMEGAGRQVAAAVLHHHERRDGFGYPRGLVADALPAKGEILAAAEWLAGLMRSGRNLVAGAQAGMKLMPGGFSPAIVRAIARCADAELTETDASHRQTGDVLSHLIQITDAFERHRHASARVHALIQAGTGASPVIAFCQQRMERIERSLVSSGLLGEEPLVLFERLNALADPRLLVEIDAILTEIEWRLRELERESLFRASSLSAGDAHILNTLLDELKGEEPL